MKFFKKQSKRSKSFLTATLALGAAQALVIVLFSGCQQSAGITSADAQTRPVVSSTLGGGSAQMNESGSASQAQNPSYVRISRAFFEKDLEAKIKLTGRNGQSAEYNSPVSWVQYPPTAEAPAQGTDPQLGQVLADFRDFVACAEMNALGNARLCFKVMGDVSNLGLNDNEMTLRGIESISAAPPASNDCSSNSAMGNQSTSPSQPAADGGAPSRYRVKSVSTSPKTLLLEFSPSDGCGPQVQLTLTQVS